MFKWQKLGRIFNPVTQGNDSWMQEQAQNPYPIDMGKFVRVYFNCRSKKDDSGKSKSLAGFVDLDKLNNFSIINISEDPILNHGNIGDFDEFGIMAGSVIKTENDFLLFYVGWTRMVAVPYNWAIGLAKSTDNGATFQRIGNGPIIGVSNKEPYLQAGCTSIININGVFHLWYTSGIKWISTDSKPESVYQIMHATSSDCINWVRDGIPIIKEVVLDEAQASPTVIFFNNCWHMFFSYRHSTDFRNKTRGYRLGYAWSKDLLKWTRDDEKAGINVSNEGWDSEMICYPSISKIDNDIYLFYCGNDFGKEGFGIAKLIL